MVHIIPAFKGCFTSSTNQTFFFLLSFLLSLINERNTTTFSSPSMALSAFSNFYNDRFSAPDDPYSYAPSDCNGSTLFRIFHFYIHIFLFSYYFHLFHFYFQGIFYRQVCGHTFHISCTTAYIVYYMHPMLFLNQFFPFLILIFLYL